MKTISDYRRHVEECKVLLRGARTPDERKMIMQMAETWEYLAVARERRLAKGEISGDD
jgi:hypothetical protein